MVSRLTGKVPKPISFRVEDVPNYKVGDIVVESTDYYVVTAPSSSVYGITYHFEDGQQNLENAIKKSTELLGTSVLDHVKEYYGIKD